MDVFQMIKDLKSGRSQVEEAELVIGRLQKSPFDVFAALKDLKKERARVGEAINIMEGLQRRRSHNIQSAGKGITGRRGRTWTTAQRKEQGNKARARAEKRRQVATAPAAVFV